MTPDAPTPDSARPAARPGAPHTSAAAILGPEEIAAVIEALAAFDPAVIYLFGSAVVGVLRPDSDLDLAFWPPAPCDPWAVFQAAQTLARRWRREVDLVDLRRASTVLRKEVFRTGRRLATFRPREADEFEMYTLNDYTRLNEERAPVLRALGVPLPPELSAGTPAPLPATPSGAPRVDFEDFLAAVGAASR